MSNVEFGIGQIQLRTFEIRNSKFAIFIMSDIAIRVEHLSKQYAIGTGKYRYDTLRDQLAHGLKSLFGFNGHRFKQNSKLEIRNSKSDTIWALKDVSFEVKEGDVVGIIGRNGSGKSTLLKILSRVTVPTSGYARICGRVGSLLEVGTGFHPELTGRENIYLNGAILGMKKTEIDRKFDEIVAFAEIEKFIDTPVKHYSSGMYVRLAFAVAAHLEPEILIVDEVLAVGDTQFQKKCLGKMQDISTGQGRTVLFVSHNMDAIRRLCSRCLLLEDGQLIAYGNTASIAAQYLSSHSYKAQPHEWIDVSHASRTGTGEARFVAVQYSSVNEAVAFQPYPKGPLEFVLAVVSDSPRSIGSIAVTLHDLSGTRLVNADTRSIDRMIDLREGLNLVRLKIKKLYLNPGIYRLALWLANARSSQSTRGVYDYVESACEIEVINLDSQGHDLNPHCAVTCHFELLEVSCHGGDQEGGRQWYRHQEEGIRFTDSYLNELRAPNKTR
jgi:lipopolysaccharide transport system ATP-binding protein